MRSVRFTSTAVSQLARYIQLYRDAYWELFRDTGIWSEDSIRAQYENLANALFDQILHAIKRRLSVKIVLGRKSAGLKQEIILYVSHRVVIVHYTENKNERIVELIHIKRKPILF